MAALTLWILISIATGDDTRQAAFRDSLTAQNTVVELSHVARDKSGDSSTQELASTIASTTASDQSKLSGHYDSEYDEAPDSAYTEAITELEEAEEGIEQLYLESSNEYLDYSLERLKLVRHNGNSAELSTAIETAIRNHEDHLEEIESRLQ